MIKEITEREFKNDMAIKRLINASKVNYKCSFLNLIMLRFYRSTFTFLKARIGNNEKDGLEVRYIIFYIKGSLINLKMTSFFSKYEEK